MKFVILKWAADIILRIINGCFLCRCSERLNSDTEEGDEAEKVEEDGGCEAGEFGEGYGEGNVSFREVKMERRRKKILQEILDTELTYQRHLEYIVKVSDIWFCFGLNIDIGFRIPHMVNFVRCSKYWNNCHW